MKKITLYLALTIVIASCDQMKKNRSDHPGSEKAQDQEIMDVSEEAKGLAEKDAVEVEIPDTELSFMITYKDKYAGQEKLFENEVLAARLKKLDRFNYDAMLKLWNTETPIVIEEGILHMSGCKQHDCPSSAYDFFLDVENDNINIYHFRSNMLRIYQETGIIELPPGFAEEMEIKKSNAKIGEIDDTESTYSLTTE